MFGFSFSLWSAEEHPSWAAALLSCLADLLQPELLGREVLNLLRLGKHPLSRGQWGWAVTPAPACALETQPGLGLVDGMGRAGEVPAAAAW